MDRLRIVQIGSGNVATHLSKALKDAGHHIVQVVGRSLENAQALGTQLGTAFTNSLAQLDSEADLYIISVADGDIPNVASLLPKLSGVVVHTSGSTPMETLKNTSDRCGVFYPLQTFSKLRDISLKGVPFCIEATDRDVVKTLSKVAQSIGGVPVEMDSQQRRWLHLMGVMSCNFVNHLFRISQEVGQSQGIGFSILKPLVEETISKAFDNGPEKSQTGPAVRGDLDTMGRHLEMLVDFDGRWKEIYGLLSKSIMKAGGMSPDKLDI